jgi:hypothetical protein
MNCEKCQENLSPFLDGELDEASAVMVRSHLISCEPCASLFEEFVSILDNCVGLDVDSPLPPNPDALWCRINNILETEVKKSTENDLPPETPSERRWDFSLLQIASAIIGIALISSLLTVVGIRNYFEPSSDDGLVRSSESPSVITRFLGKLGLTETPQATRERKLLEQLAAIEYWDRRVKMRRAEWDERMRTAFDRNLREIDHAVHEYTMLLEQDPDDTLTMEMLDSALDDKMNLLRQFAGL